MELLHPPLTGFPSVLLTCAVICELIAWLRSSSSWARSARTFFLAACAASPLTYLSGYIGSEWADRSFSVPDSAIGDHQSTALLFLLALFAALLLDWLAHSTEKPALHAARRAGLLAAAVLAVWTSYQGGQLVFSHGAGVLLNPDSLQAPR